MTAKETKKIQNRMRQLVSLLDFEGCQKAFLKSDDSFLDDLLMDRMIELDKERFSEWANSDELLVY